MLEESHDTMGEVGHMIGSDRANECLQQMLTELQYWLRSHLIQEVADDTIPSHDKEGGPQFS